MSILGIVFRSIPALFRNRSRLTLENLALRQQIAVTPTWAWFPLRRLFDRTPTRVRPRGLNVLAGSTLAGAGKFSSQVVWDPAGPVPEGDIR